MLGNADVRISYVVAVAASPLYRNAIGDECVYVEAGTATVETVFGALEVGPGRLRDPARGRPRTAGCPAGDEPLRAYAIEANSHITPAEALPVEVRAAARARARTASATCAAPAEPLLVERHRRRGLRQAPRRRARRAGRHRSTSCPDHPFDVVGWDGCLYPYAFNVADFEPITGRVHQPPPVHQVFEGANFVICNFVPRKVDYHPLAIPVPYYHSNVDSDEVMFYFDGDYEARKGSGIGQGSISLHPGGHSHGPQPGAVERSLGAEFFDELAVMVDTFRPLALGEAGTASRRRALRLVVVAAADRRRDLGRRAGRHAASAVDNLPYGVFSTPTAAPRAPASRIGDARPRPARRSTGDDGARAPARSTRSWRGARRAWARAARAAHRAG